MGTVIWIRVHDLYIGCNGCRSAVLNPATLWHWWHFLATFCFIFGCNQASADWAQYRPPHTADVRLQLESGIASVETGHIVPDRVKLSFAFFDIRALWGSGQCCWFLVCLCYQRHCGPATALYILWLLKDTNSWPQVRGSRLVVVSSWCTPTRFVPNQTNF